jgi:hypothetical protein
VISEYRQRDTYSVILSMKRRVMPKGLQIKMLKDLFRKFNKDRGEAGQDTGALIDEIDWENVVNDTLTFGENLSILRSEYPNIVGKNQ